MSTQWNQQLSRYVFLSNIWNKTFENKAIAKDHRMQSKLTECKISELKYADRNLTT